MVPLTATMVTLVKKARAHIEAGDKLTDKGNDHYIAAGRFLAQAKAKKPAGIPWYTFVEDVFKISRARADALIQIGDGRTTVAQVRAGGAARKEKERAENNSRKSAVSHSGSASAKSSASACDYDWSKPDPKDFGDPSEMYGKQADHYFHEATHLAESLPILSDGVDVNIIRSKISAAQAVADAWLGVVVQLKSRVKRG